MRECFKKQYIRHCPRLAPSSLSLGTPLRTGLYEKVLFVRRGDCNFSFLIVRSFRHSLERLLRAPAAGYRYVGSGVLTLVGTEGDSWSSSLIAAQNPNASYLAFASADWVNTFRNAGRAFGFSVRCVQHLQEVAFCRSPVCSRQQKSRSPTTETGKTTR